MASITTATVVPTPIATGSNTTVNDNSDKENIRSPNNQANPSSKLSTPSDSPFVLGLWVCIVTIEATPSES
ncbi:hypothetical protein V6N11_004169 [Hibiscus sabdariffa]|uniref:Uncharacterized protein n=1 Tax=Hibiscus sabdariffa TaxID=183260 RepID=A0ABR2SFQ3_9ROSI